MTAISPLQSIHRKGLFGNHHKKSEKDLLKITELKECSIIQVAQYKNSKISLNNITIDGLDFSLKRSIVSSNINTRILWSAPNVWLVISNKENIEKIVKEKCDSKNFAVTDISHSRAIIQIEGQDVLLDTHCAKVQRDPLRGNIEHMGSRRAPR